MVKTLLDIAKISRWKNLLIITLMPLIIGLYVFDPAIEGSYIPLFTRMSTSEDLLLLGLFMALVAAGGNIINDINDYKVDSVNKPNQKLLLDLVPEKVAYTLYVIFTLSGLSLAYYLNAKIEDGMLVTVGVFAAMLLWVYSSYFKASVLIGNIIISLLSGIVPLVYFYFESQLYIGEYAATLKSSFGSIFELSHINTLLWYCLLLSIFAFAISLLREIVKDLQDQKGDSLMKGRTLPIYLGETMATNVAIVLGAVILLAVVYVSFKATLLTPFNNVFFQSYVAIFIDLPLAFIVFLLLKKPSNFGLISGVCKLVMLTGTCTAFLYSML